MTFHVEMIFKALQCQECEKLFKKEARITNTHAKKVEYVMLVVKVSR